MYILSAVVDKAQSEVALYNREYKLLLKKTGASADLSKLCLDAVADGNAKLADVAYAGIAVDSAVGDPAAVAAELEKKIDVKCYGASCMNARALG